MTDAKRKRDDSHSTADTSLASSALSALPNQVANIDETLFPDYVPITEQFGNDPSVPPPDYILDDRWWKATGQELHAAAIRTAEAIYGHKQRNHETLLASLEQENKHIDWLNERRRQDYDDACLWHQKQLEKHQLRLEAHERSEKRACIEHKELGETWQEKWSVYSVLDACSSDISRALLLQIHRRASCAAAKSVFLALASLAGVARLYVTLALFVPIWNHPWYLILATIAACQSSYLLFLLLSYHAYCSRRKRLLEQEHSFPALITQLPEWHKMYRRLRLDQGARRAHFNELRGDKNLALLFVPKVVFKSDTISAAGLYKIQVDGSGFLVFVSSLIPVVSFVLFIKSYRALVPESFFVNEILDDEVATSSTPGVDSLRLKFGCRPPFERNPKSPPSEPSAPHLSLLVHKPLPQPPVFITPPKPTRPK